MSDVPVADRLLGPNPFPADDPRHAQWRDVCLQAAEDEADILEESRQRDWDEIVPLALEKVFVVRAAAAAKLLISSIDDVPVYENALARFAESVFLMGGQMCLMPHLDGELRLLLDRAVAHWKWRGLKYARGGELGPASGHPGAPVPAGASTGASPDSHDPEHHDGSLPAAREIDFVGGRNLASWLAATMERRRITVHRLHVLSGIDRKTIKAIRTGHQVRRLSLLKLLDGLREDGLAVNPADVPLD